MATAVDASTLVWYTLLDPTTEQFFYACPSTGACSWRLPTSGSILQGHLPDWWEMFDETTGRPYYFNNKTQATLWVLPPDLNVIPVPLSSEDDAKIRNVLGPPPEVEASPNFTIEEVIDTSGEEEPVEPEHTSESTDTAPKSSPRRLANDDSTRSEWVAMEDPRTGFNYFMNRKTMKLAWGTADMLHQEIAAEEAKAEKVVDAPSPVAFRSRKSQDPDYITDAWEDHSVTPIASTLPAFPGIQTSSSGLELEAKKPLFRPTKVPPTVPSTSAASQEAKGKPHSGSGSSNNSANSNSPPTSTTPTHMGLRKGSPVTGTATASRDPSIPTPPPSKIPAKKPYRASIFMRPLPKPIHSRQNLGYESSPEMAPQHKSNTRQTPVNHTFNSSAKQNASPAPAPVVSAPKAAPKQAPFANELRMRADSHAATASPRQGDDRVRSTSYEASLVSASITDASKEVEAVEVINVAQVFKRQTPGAKKTSISPAPGASAGVSHSVSATSIPAKFSAPPMPSSVSQKFSNGGISRGTPTVANTQVTSSAPVTSGSTAQKPALPTGGSGRQLPPKPFSGLPPPIPAKYASPVVANNPSGSRPPAFAPPQNPAVLVTLERGRYGSRANRVSFRASISRVAPPTLAEILGEEEAWGASTLPNPATMASALSAGTSPPHMRPAPSNSALPSAIGPTIGVAPRSTNAAALASAFASATPKTPTSAPKVGLRTSQSANTIGHSAPNPYANSLPAARVEAMRSGTGGAVASSSSTVKTTPTKTRPVLTKAFTSTSPIAEPLYGGSRSPPGGFGGPPTISAELKAQIKHFQLEGFAAQFFKSHRRGLFRRAVPIRDRLKWTQGGLKAPLLKLKSDLAKKSLGIFKNIQICMGDRELMTTQEERYKLMVEIFDLGLNIAALRDEIFCQLCKQTTLNPNADSNLRGWTMIALFLQYFAPTKDLEHWFADYCREHEKNPQAAIVPYVEYALRLLNRPSQTGSTLRVPEVDEVQLAIANPLQPRLFGVTLEQALEAQKIQRCPEATARPDFPYVITALIGIVTRLRGTQTEGIFRIPGSHLQCTKLRLQLEAGNYSGSGLLDPHVPASVLKWWLRDLTSPVIPPQAYQACVEAAKSSNPQKACIAVIDSLPPLNQIVVRAIIEFVQILARPENVSQTKMAVGSLAIVFSPNLLRTQATEMSAVFEAQKWEQTFVTNLINHLPSSS